MAIVNRASGAGRLDRSSVPMRLWRKAALGAWHPEQLELGADRRDWCALPPTRRATLLRLCALFHLGERAVTEDLLPIARVVAAEGRLEEAVYLASFLCDEAKHVDLFDRFLVEVAMEPGDLAGYRHAAFDRVIGEHLRPALARLSIDDSPSAQVRAVVTYTLVVEGIMAETGSYVFRRLLAADGVMPAMRQALTYLARDESRHIAFGVYLLGRLVAEHGDAAYRAFLDAMSGVKPAVEESTRQFVRLVEEDGAAGIRADELQRFSAQRFAGRARLISNARTRSVGRQFGLEVIQHEEQALDA